MQKIYRHIYFDLDRTIWDFDQNSAAALSGIYFKHNLQSAFHTPVEFISVFRKHNERLWAQYRDGNIRKSILRTKRFELTLAERKISNSSLVSIIEEEYLDQCSCQTGIFPGTHEVLSYLKEKNYFLYILTNGFKETQYRKLKSCDLEKYFHKIFTTDSIGYNKPHKKVFHWAVSSVKARKEECIMIGDDQDADIMGAKKYGIDQIFFNPELSETRVAATFQIRSLDELRKIF
jgi:putative hydrolase of the HAD superfamily